MNISSQQSSQHSSQNSSQNSSQILAGVLPGILPKALTEVLAECLDFSSHDKRLVKSKIMWIQGLKQLGLLSLVKSAVLVRAGWLQPCLGPD